MGTPPVLGRAATATFRVVSQSHRPEPRYLPAEFVLSEMASFGHRRLHRLTSGRALVLALIGGGFIAMGALFSLLLADGADSPGTTRLLEGIGFSTGFFFIVLSEAVLFTEANVVIPATLLDTKESALGIARFWGIAWVGNFVGALVIGGLVAVVQEPSSSVTGLLDEIVDQKMSFHAEGGALSWFELILSGMLANWMVGMAAFFAMMGRSIIGKYIPVLLAVTLFVSAGLQHSPANMGYFSLQMMEGAGPGWAAAVGWNIIPVGIGNILGGTLLVALPFWYAFRRTE